MRMSKILVRVAIIGVGVVAAVLAIAAGGCGPHHHHPHGPHPYGRTTDHYEEGYGPGGGRSYSSGRGAGFLNGRHLDNWRPGSYLEFHGDFNPRNTIPYGEHGFNGTAASMDEYVRRSSQPTWMHGNVQRFDSPPPQQARGNVLRRSNMSLMKPMPTKNRSSRKASAKVEVDESDRQKKFLESFTPVSSSTVATVVDTSTPTLEITNDTTHDLSVYMGDDNDREVQPGESLRFTPHRDPVDGGHFYALFMETDNPAEFVLQFHTIDVSNGQVTVLERRVEGISQMIKFLKEVQALIQ
jgi:hypothetical protein